MTTEPLVHSHAMPRRSAAQLLRWRFLGYALLLLIVILLTRPAPDPTPSATDAAGASAATSR